MLLTTCLLVPSGSRGPDGVSRLGTLQFYVMLCLLHVLSICWPVSPDKCNRRSFSGSQALVSCYAGALEKALSR